MEQSKPSLNERLFPNVKTLEGLRKARTAGVLSATYLGVAFIFTILTTENALNSSLAMSVDDLMVVILSAIGAVGSFLAAFRIFKKKGGIAIWFILAYASYSLVTKFSFGIVGLGTYLTLLAVWGAVNGVRATRVTETALEPTTAPSIEFSDVDDTEEPNDSGSTFGGFGIGFGSNDSVIKAVNSRSKNKN